MRKGLVLVVVLWVLVAVTAVCLAMGLMARTQAMSVMRHADICAEDAIFSSALNAAMLILEADDSAYDTSFDTWSGGDDSRFSLNIGDGYASIHRVEADGSVEFGISDEASRLNANSADLDMLSRLPGMDSVSAGRFISIRDLLVSAKAAASVALVTSVTNAPIGPCGPVSSEDQLARMLMRSIHPAMVYPGDTGAAQPLSSPPPSGEELANFRRLPDDIAKLMRLLSIHSRASNTTASGSARLNLNEADMSQLTETLGGALSTMQLAAIAVSIEQQPLNHAAELLHRELSVRDIHGVLQPVTFSSEDFVNIYDSISCTNSSYEVGLVNINTAPLEVLGCLPGIADGFAEMVIEYRQSVAPELLDRPTWLLNVLPVDVYITVAPYVTVRSDQFRCLISCRSSDGRGALFAQAVIQRYMGQSSVIALERCRGIWHDSLTGP